MLFICWVPCTPSRSVCCAHVTHYVIVMALHDAPRHAHVDMRTCSSCRAAKTLLCYLGETNPTLYHWLVSDVLTMTDASSCCGVTRCAHSDCLTTATPSLLLNSADFSFGLACSSPTTSRTPSLSMVRACYLVLGSATHCFCRSLCVVQARHTTVGFMLAAVYTSDERSTWL